LLVDTHCHLNFDWFNNDRAEVLQHAQDAGLGRILNPGIDLLTSRQALALAQASSLVYCAVGVHPNDASSWNEATLDGLRSLAQQPRVVAIGEIGLDYYRDRTPAELQRQVFAAQLNLAAERSLPVVIHTRSASPSDRQASDDVLSMLADWVGELKHQESPLAQHPGVLHSFSEDVTLARRAIDLGFYLGITGPVTFRKADELRQVVAEMPIERLLAETDAPFLTPHPHRGERNEPAYVRFVTEKIAQIKNLAFEAAAEITTANAERLFRW
jgi:TatD DNase family protein